MKGTLFSADFITDQDGNERLLELNTDTQVYGGFESELSFDPLIDVLTDNSASIKEVHVVYKENIHSNFEALLSSSIATNAPWITTYEQHKIAATSIYPTSPTDSGSRFILRCAYNENAILDSTYAKGTFNALKLMYQNDATGSIPELYHSSSAGYYNTLISATLPTQTNVPHLVRKHTVEQTHEMLELLTIGSSSMTDQERFQLAIDENADTTRFIQKFYIGTDAYSRGKAASTRGYYITYGSNLDVIELAVGETDARFDLPTTLDASLTSSANINKVNRKHFYELTNKPFTTAEDYGILSEEQIQLSDLTYISASSVTTSSVLRSYHLNGIPDSDSVDVIDAWSIDGSVLPTGSYFSTASVIGYSSVTNKSNVLIQLEDSNGDLHDYGNATRVLVYDTVADKLKFKAANMVTSIHQLVQISGSHLPVSRSFTSIMENSDNKFHDYNVESDDLFITKTGPSPKAVIAHNILAGKV